MLFDLDADIVETRDLSKTHPKVVARLLALAEWARTDIGDLDRLGENARFFDDAPTRLKAPAPGPGTSSGPWRLDTKKAGKCAGLFATCYGVGSGLFAVLLHEALDTAFCIDELLVAGEEGVGGRCYVELDHRILLAFVFDRFLGFNRGTGQKLCAAGHVEKYDVSVCRMDVRFHDARNFLHKFLVKLRPASRIGKHGKQKVH